jgi:CheY-like chemotaxis protein
MTISDSEEHIKKELDSIHSFYLNILNSLPNIVYWIDVNCNLLGCNQKFIHLLGLNSILDLKENPYEQMQNHAQWPKKQIEKLRLDDMKVIFSGEPQCDKNEKLLLSPQSKPANFLITRIPLWDKHNTIDGVVVILTEVLNLPLNQPSKLPPNGKVKKKVHPLILMVEDNIVAQKVEEELLTDVNCQVKIAGSGAEALETFKPGKYDLVLMDINLGDTSGYMVAKKMREKEKGTKAHVPIIALTMYQADIVKEDVKEYLMDGVITKPLTSEQVKQLIERYVRNDVSVEVTGLKHDSN